MQRYGFRWRDMRRRFVDPLVLERQVEDPSVVVRRIEVRRRYQYTAYALLPWSLSSSRLFKNIAVIAVQLRHLGADPSNQTLAGSPWFIFDPPVCFKGVPSSSPANPQPIQVASHVRGGAYQMTISVCSITFCLYKSEYPRIMFRSHFLLCHNLKVGGR